MPFINAIASYSQLVGKYTGGLYISRYIIVPCASVITLSATLTGDTRGHTFLWEQQSGTPVTFLAPVDQPTTLFQQTAIADDKVFIFWIDKGQPYAIQIPVLVSAKPTEIAYTGYNYNQVLTGSFGNGNLFSSAQQIVTMYGVSPLIPLPSLEGSASSYLNGYPTWEVVFQPPTSSAGLYSYSIFSTQGSSNGYQLVAPNIPYQVGNSVGLTYQPIPVGSTVRIDANYNYPHGYSVSSPPIQAVARFQAVAGDRIGTVSFGRSPVLQTTLITADYRIIGQSATDYIGETTFASAPPPRLGSYTSTTVSTGINTGSTTTETSATTTYVSSDYRLYQYPTVGDSIAAISFNHSPNPLTLTYTVAGSGIISLG